MSSEPIASPKRPARRRFFDHPVARWGGQILLILGIYLGIRVWQTWGTVSGPAPALEARLLDGSPASLTALRGQGPVMVHFWATWCGVCKAEEGNVEAVTSDHPAITVATQSGPAAEVAGFLEERGVELPAVADPDGRLAARWGVRSFPTTFVVGEDGNIRHVEVGYTTELGMRARLWLASVF